MEQCKLNRVKPSRNQQIIICKVKPLKWKILPKSKSRKFLLRVKEAVQYVPILTLPANTFFVTLDEASRQNLFLLQSL